MSDQEHAVRQVRGSSVLLFGRVMSLAVNLLLQLLLVRYFAKEVFGAFAFAWASVELGTFLVTAGLNKSLSRYIPLYQEAGDWPKVRQSVIRSLCVMLALGLASVVALELLNDWVARHGWVDPLSLRLLRIMIILVPLDAIGFLFQDLFVAFQDITAVFVRRYIVAPGLRLAGVIGVMVAGGGAEAMAYGYVAGGAIGLLLYLWMFRRLWRERMQGSSTVTQETPRFGELVRFGLAVLTSQLGTMVRMTAVVFLLQFLRNAEEVGDYRAVLPFARLNLMVLDSFTIAFVPAAARLLSRGEERKIGRLVDTCSTWVAVLGFPIFLASFALSPTLSRYVLGENYADTWPIMSALSIGFLAESLLGFAPQVLRAYARLRPVLIADFAALALNLVIAMILIPHWGALGAAIGVVASSLAAAVGVMVAARRVNRWACRWSTVGGLLLVTGGTALVVAVGLQLWDLPLVVQALLAAGACLFVLQAYRRRLVVDDVFPEVRKLPFIGWLVPARAPEPVVASSASSVSEP